MKNTSSTSAFLPAFSDPESIARNPIGLLTGLLRHSERIVLCYDGPDDGVIPPEKASSVDPTLGYDGYFLSSLTWVHPNFRDVQPERYHSSLLVSVNLAIKEVGIPPISSRLSAKGLQSLVLTLYRQGTGLALLTSSDNDKQRDVYGAKVIETGITGNTMDTDAGRVHFGLQGALEAALEWHRKEEESLRRF